MWVSILSAQLRTEQRGRHPRPSINRSFNPLRPIKDGATFTAISITPDSWVSILSAQLRTEQRKQARAKHKGYNVSILSAQLRTEQLKSIYCHYDGYPVSILSAQLRTEQLKRRIPRPV